MKKVFGIAGVIAGIVVLAVGLMWYTSKDDIQFDDKTPEVSSLEVYTTTPTESQDDVTDSGSTEIASDENSGNQSGGNTTTGSNGKTTGKTTNKTTGKTTVNSGSTSGTTTTTKAPEPTGATSSTNKTTASKTTAATTSKTTAKTTAKSTTAKTTAKSTTAKTTTAKTTTAKTTQATTTANNFFGQIQNSWKTTEGNYKYEIIVNMTSDGTVVSGTARILKYTGSGGTINIPSSTSEGYKVVGIAEKAFFGAKATSITIPETITSIGRLAFANICGDGSLSVAIPTSVTSIGGGAFAGINVTSVSSQYTLDKGNIYHGTTLVSCSGVSSMDAVGQATLKIKSGTKEIEYGAAYGCKSIYHVEFPDSLTKFKYDDTNVGTESYAFYNCANLQYVVIPSKVDYIPGYTFTNCSALTKVIIMYVTPEVLADKKEGLIFRTSAFEGTAAYTKHNIFAADGVTPIS